MNHKSCKFLIVSCIVSVLSIMAISSCGNGATPDTKEPESTTVAPAQLDTTQMDSADTRPVKAGN